MIFYDITRFPMSVVKIKLSHRVRFASGILKPSRRPLIKVTGFFLDNWSFLTHNH